MPIYEYSCKACSQQFEVLVRGGREPATCAACGSAKIERRMSLPTVKSESTRKLSMAAAKRRDRAQAKDAAHEHAKYVASHDD